MVAFFVVYRLVIIGIIIYYFLYEAIGLYMGKAMVKLEHIYFIILMGNFGFYILGDNMTS